MNKRKSGGAYPAWLPEEIIQTIEDYKRDYSLRVTGNCPAHLVPINLDYCDADDCSTDLEYHDELHTELSAIKKQRDELLAALQAVATWWYGTPSASPESRYGENALGVYVQVFTAIDRATSENHIVDFSQLHGGGEE